MYNIYLFNEYEQLSDEFIESALEILPEERRHKALRYRRKIDMQNCVITYLLLKYALHDCFGINSFQLSYGKYGKPYLREYPNIGFSFSHCDIACVVAISDCPIGVDIQDIRPFSWDIANQVCSQRELIELGKSQDKGRLFTKMWVIKESYVKMLGIGIAYDLKCLDTTNLLQGIINVL